ncbi:MAG TPA: iron-containing alcohol dehydrogenase family protein [Clostridia bacterium]
MQYKDKGDRVVFYTEVRNKSIIKSSPANYIISRDALKESGDYISRYGKTAQIVGGVRALASLGDSFHTSLNNAGLTWQEYVFRGEVCDSQIDSIMENARNCGAEVMVGVGGGKAIDAAKIAAYNLGIPVVCIPTIAATCAAVTPMSVLYHENGIYKQDVFFPATPDMVIVDPAVIANAPVEYLKSGILDAIAKWYEGSASIIGSKDIADIFDECALRVAAMLFEEMQNNAAEAIASVKERKVSEALITVINLNIFFAGMIQSLGIKAVRNGIAHSIHNGLTVLAESHHILHGYKVGYGIYVQLTLLGAQQNMKTGTAEFFRKIGFTPSFNELGLPYTEDTVKAVAEKTYNDPMMRKVPFNFITADMIAAAMHNIEKEYLTR